MNDLLDALWGFAGRRRTRVVAGTILSGIMGFWCMQLITGKIVPQLIATGVVVAIFHLVVWLNDREFKDHLKHDDYRLVDFPHDMVPEPHDRFLINSKLIKGDVAVRFVDRYHRITKSGVYLKTAMLVPMASVLVLFPGQILHHHVYLPLQVRVLVAIAAGILVRYMFTTWARRVIVLTKSRLLVIRDPAWPRRDSSQEYSVDKMAKTELDKSGLAQWLPTHEIIQRVKFMELGAQDWTELPLTTNPTGLHHAIADAIYPVPEPHAGSRPRHDRRNRRV